jgi:DNA-binding GntR family transcriptional regulator
VDDVTGDFAVDHCERLSSGSQIIPARSAATAATPTAGSILTPDAIIDYNRQHRSIYNALNERDAVAAQSLIVEHLEKARDDLLRASRPSS